MYAIFYIHTLFALPVCAPRISTHALVCHHQFTSFLGQQIHFHKHANQNKENNRKRKKCANWTCVWVWNTHCRRWAAHRCWICVYLLYFQRNMKKTQQIQLMAYFRHLSIKVLRSFATFLSFHSWICVDHNESQEFWFRLFGPHTRPGRAFWFFIYTETVGAVLI